MDLAHAELIRILAPQNLHAWAVRDEGNTSSSEHHANKIADKDHRYYFLDQAGNSSHGDTALHRLLALHTTPPAAVHNFLHHAAQHRQMLARTVTTTDTQPQHENEDDEDDDGKVSSSIYSHLTARPPSPCDPNNYGVTALHVAVHRNSWHVVKVVDCLLQACPALASMPMMPSQTYPLHVVMGHNLTIQESVLHSLLNADPAVAGQQDSRGDTPLSLLWKNVLRFRWARAWDVNGVVPV
jgi:hypothetical protein